ncbi:DUF6896 domain-containing protein [Actinomadura sp. 9N407]|uniref:DUF6896 domain-containing protein n=1 Tax=Actinomadura sp. 9N407 TaxID=3375154 RepID=UPI0037B828BB
MASEPSPETIRRVATRGKAVVFDVPTGESIAIAQRLNAQLAGESIRVIVPGPARITALQLVSEEEARRVLPELEALVADFRERARSLTRRFDGGAFTEENWIAWPHGEHCRFENLENGVIVEANIEFPDRVDAYFLLLFAETSRRYPGILGACVHGYHDMYRMLELAGVL